MAIEKVTKADKEGFATEVIELLHDEKKLTYKEARNTVGKAYGILTKKINENKPKKE